MNDYTTVDPKTVADIAHKIWAFMFVSTLVAGRQDGKQDQR